MGSWFSNIHIRKNVHATEETIQKYIGELMASHGYMPVSSRNDADMAVAVLEEADCPWISVYSDMLSLEEPEKNAGILAPLSAELHTDVLAIACFDSDYLYLNLVNAGESTDAWLGIGSAAGLGIKRRSGLRAWKKKVSDFSAFSECAGKQFVFAEDFLAEAEMCLSIPASRSAASYELLRDLELHEKAKYFYFRLPDALRTKEQVRLIPCVSSGTPCSPEKPCLVNGINIGGESRGLSVYFLGPYVEKDEITFSDVCFVKMKRRQMVTVPFDLTKVQLPDGQWAYCYHDPGFRIPPKVASGLPLAKRMREEEEKNIAVRFVPRGNPRKMLDITVALVPEENPEGASVWNVWQRWGSKKAFIEQYNDRWDKVRSRSASPDSLPPALKEEDFD